MRYISTRGGIAPIPFDEAVMMGLASDGGLLVPESLPQVEADILADWSRLRFQDLAVEVLKPFVGECIPEQDLIDLINESYASFSHPAVTPLVPLGEQHILELFHGPTAAFKDVALQFLGNLFEYLLARRGGHLNILGATSGDTGSAAIAGVRGKARIQIFILYPQGRISPIQERQMTTVLDANVHCIAIRGTFDDAQRIVKQLFQDLRFKAQYALGAVNSINWARILAQMVYYFYAWGQLCQGNPECRVSFSVPTGNFGDVFAGYLARRMGLPVERLIIATNQNDILTRFVHTGIYAAGEVQHTLSPAMDIQLASNFERYLYFLSGERPEVVQNWLESLTGTGELRIDEDQRAQVARDFQARAVTDAETLEQIRRTYEEEGYILDPHTAVGVRAASALDCGKCVCLATAHPAKFGEAVVRAIGREAPYPPALKNLLDRPTRSILLDADETAVRQFMQRTLAP